jgi:indoleamine 2,3-dioxygenase
LADADVAPSLRRLDDLASALPDHLTDDDLRPRLRDLDPPPEDAYADLRRPELRRLYRVTGFLAAAHVNKVGAPTADRVPAGVAVPLYEAARRLGRTPMLSYDAYVLENWTTGSSDGDFRPTAVEPSLRFIPERDEQWFVAIHVAIEATGGPALAAVGDAQQGVREDDPDRVRDALERMAAAFDSMDDLMDRMPEHNDPEVFGRGFRPYLETFDGVVYEGVDALDGPQTYRGASGAQSSLLPAVDASLGIDHGENPLVEHLHAHRRHMPPEHREFLEAAATGPSIRAYVESRPDLRSAYNNCIDGVVRFREHHVEVVRHYLADAMGVESGTGGTPYGDYLDGFVTDTRAALL